MLAQPQPVRYQARGEAPNGFSPRAEQDGSNGHDHTVHQPAPQHRGDHASATLDHHAADPQIQQPSKAMLQIDAVWRPANDLDLDTTLAQGGPPARVGPLRSEDDRGRVGPENRRV